MPMRRPASRALRVLAMALIVTGTMAGIASASVRAAGCQSWTGGQPPSPGSTDSRFRGVTVLSACNAWAVGSQIGTGQSQTLIEHWNGSSWAVVPTPDPGGSFSLLAGIGAASPASIWAVGRLRTSAGEDRTLIEHWNGTIWTVVPSPGPPGSELRGIRVISARDAWAVGDTFDGTRSRTLILHWNGSTWRQVASPDPGGPSDSDLLAAVTATSANNAWAAGEITNGTTFRTLILRWNGARWARVPSPNPGTRAELFAVAATSATNAWAGGATVSGGKSRTLILHWNGRTWTRSRSPGGGAGTDSFLTGLAATSAGNALAVGGYTGGGSAGDTLILRWTGSAWHRVPSPDPGPSGNTLFAVAASSAGSVWAVGNFREGLLGQALAIHSGPATASASGCEAWTGAPPPSPGTAFNFLTGVTVLSRCNAWAVGSGSFGGVSFTLAEHWNGSAWSVVPTASPGSTGNGLSGISASSPTSIWAVGQADSGALEETLILRGNGSKLTPVSSPSPGTEANELNSVSTASARDAWAVGDYSSGSGDKALILHWNGTAWKQQRGPGLPVGTVLAAVAATSASNAWAVGLSDTLAGNRTVILHWNGTRWTQVTSPNPGKSNTLTAVAATSEKNAWAVGYTSTGGTDHTLILHWNGRRWNRVPSPGSSFGTNSRLQGVAATSGANAWAVGDGYNNSGIDKAFILRWNGSAWRRAASPELTGSSFLESVAAASAGDAWSVGSAGDGPARAYAIGCC